MMSKLDTTVNVDEIMELGPCGNWPRERVEEHVPPEGITLREVLHAHHVDAANRVWLLTRCGSLSGADVVLFATAAAERALLSVGIADARSWTAVQVARLAAFGEADAVAVAEARAAAEAAEKAFEAARVAARARVKNATAEAVRVAWAWAWAWDAATEAVAEAGVAASAAWATKAATRAVAAEAAWVAARSRVKTAAAKAAARTAALAGAEVAARVTGWQPILDDIERLLGAE